MELLELALDQLLCFQRLTLREIIANAESFFFLFDQTRYSFCNPKTNIITDHLIAGYLDVLEQVRGGQVNSFEGFQFILQALER